MSSSTVLQMVSEYCGRRLDIDFWDNRRFVTPEEIICDGKNMECAVTISGASTNESDSTGDLVCVKIEVPSLVIPGFAHFQCSHLKDGYSLAPYLSRLAKYYAPLDIEKLFAVLHGLYYIHRNVPTIPVTAFTAHRLLVTLVGLITVVDPPLSQTSLQTTPVQVLSYHDSMIKRLMLVGGITSPDEMLKMMDVLLNACPNALVYPSTTPTPTIDLKDHKAPNEAPTKVLLPTNNEKKTQVLSPAADGVVKYAVGREIGQGSFGHIFEVLPPHAPAFVY